MNETESPNPSASPAANAPPLAPSAGGAEDLVHRVYRKLTAQPVLWLFVVTFAVVAWLNPAKVGLLFWGVSKLAMFAYMGQWIDERIFPHAQPERLRGIEQGTAWKRRGLIVAAAVVAGALLP